MDMDIGIGIGTEMDMDRFMITMSMDMDMGIDIDVGMDMGVDIRLFRLHFVNLRSQSGPKGSFLPGALHPRDASGEHYAAPKAWQSADIK